MLRSLHRASWAVVAASFSLCVSGGCAEKPGKKKDDAAAKDKKKAKGDKSKDDKSKDDKAKKE